MLEIITNQFQDHQIKVILINNEPWFIAKDIADVLQYSETNAMTRKHIDEDDVKTIRKTDETIRFLDGSIFGNQGSIMLINESGLYSAILGSKKPEAKQFKRWVTNEVLPSIRKTGNYSISQNFQLPKLTNETEQITELDNYFVATEKLISNLQNMKPIDLYRLDKYVQRTRNFSPLKTFEINLDSQFFLPTELGKMINKSAVEVNLMIANRGFQIRENGVWKLTETGRDFGIEIIGKFHQIKWKIKSII